MEFKEAIKIINRMCDYHKKCDGCPFGGFPHGCIEGIFEAESTDGYERILEEWAKEHPVMTNADKYIEVIKSTFGGDVGKEIIRELCVNSVLGKPCIAHCTECSKWWDEEYKEPEKEKKE